jgi:hypothetical protein
MTTGRDGDVMGKNIDTLSLTGMDQVRRQTGLAAEPCYGPG